MLNLLNNAEHALASIADSGDASAAPGVVIRTRHEGEGGDPRCASGEALELSRAIGV